MAAHLIRQAEHHRRRRYSLAYTNSNACDNAVYTLQPRYAQIQFYEQNAFKRGYDMSTANDQWAKYIKQKQSTPYWTRITNPDLHYKEHLFDLLLTYRILENSSHEYIMYPHDAIRLVCELERMGIAVIGITVWCSVPDGVHSRDCCPEGQGGPKGKGEWFNEYVHLGSCVPDSIFEYGEFDLATKSNPLVKEYLDTQLLVETRGNDRIRVSPDIYFPGLDDLYLQVISHSHAGS